MHINDIPNNYFNHLLTHSKNIYSLAEDILITHNINISKEISHFPNLSELLNMRKNNQELTNAQWEDFWDIITKIETSIVNHNLHTSKKQAELINYNNNYPILKDSQGKEYRLNEWDNSKDYIDHEMGI